MALTGLQQRFLEVFEYRDGNVMTQEEATAFINELL